MSQHDKGTHDPFEDPDRIAPRTPKAQGGLGRRGAVMSAAGVLAAALVVGGVYALAQPDEPDQGQGNPQPVALSSNGLPAAATPALVREAVPLARAALAGGLPLPQGVAAADSDQVPQRVLTAYRRAEATMAADQAGCRLPWWVVAAIGKVESEHANRGTVDATGNVLPPMRGPRLDGSIVDTQAVADTDDGRLDGDALNDRAMGPLQIVPSTWQIMARDGNGDGVADPDNIDDATLTAAAFLCSSGQDFGTEQGLAAGVLYVNDQADYARNVLTWASYYRGAVTPPAVVPAPARTSSPTLRSGTSDRPPIGATPTAEGATPAPAPTVDPSTPPPAAPAPPAAPSAVPPAPGRPGTPTRTNPPATTPTAPATRAPTRTSTPTQAPTRTPTQAPAPAPMPTSSSTPASTSSPTASQPEPTRGSSSPSTTRAPTQGPEPTRTSRSGTTRPPQPTRGPQPTTSPSSRPTASSPAPEPTSSPAPEPSDNPTGDD